MTVLGEIPNILGQFYLSYLQNKTTQKIILVNTIFMTNQGLSGTNEQFLEERRLGLESYLRQLFKKFPLDQKLREFLSPQMFTFSSD
jgi:hypothetical protein